MASVNVTVNMPPEMLADVDQGAEENDMSRAQYIRHAIREADSTPFDTPEETLAEIADDGQKGAA